MTIDGIPAWQRDAYDDESVLPCGCGPGVLNLMDETGPSDYECPDCGRRYTRGEVVEDAE